MSDVVKKKSEESGRLRCFDMASCLMTECSNSFEACVVSEESDCKNGSTLEEMPVLEDTPASESCLGCCCCNKGGNKG